MTITLYSVLMATLWSSVFIVVFYLFRRSTPFLMRYGTAPLVILIAGCLIRYLVPMDLFPYTKPISLAGGVFADLMAFLHRPIPGLPPPFCPLLFLGVVWASGTLLLLARLLWSFVACLRKSRLLDTAAPPRVLHIMGETAKRLKVKKARVALSENISVPMLICAFYPVILLPDIPYTDRELSYIFSHELTHWKNRDMWVKLLVEFCCALFWWNPLIYLLRKDLGQALELKCDLAVTALLSEKERVEYLEAILKILRASRPEPAVQPRLQAASAKLSGPSFAGLGRAKQRFELILEYRPKPKRARIQAALTSLVMLLALTFSFSFVLQPGYEPPREEIEEGGKYTELTPENSYLIKTKEGKYIFRSESGDITIGPDMVPRMKQEGFQVRESSHKKSGPQEVPAVCFFSYSGDCAPAKSSK